MGNSRQGGKRGGVHVQICHYITFFYFVIDTFNVSGSGTSMSSSDTISNEV